MTGALARVGPSGSACASRLTKISGRVSRSSVMLRYSEASTFLIEPARSFGVPQDDAVSKCARQSKHRNAPRETV